MEEIWKDIPGLEGFYQASNLGRVRSLKRTFTRFREKSVNNQYFCTFPGKTMRLNLREKGYLYITVSVKSKRRSIQVHRAVALAFLPNIHNLAAVNHINGIKTDNKIENLEWCSQGDNNRHAYRIGLQPLGKDKITAQRVIHTVDLIVFGCIKKAADFYGLKYDCLAVMLRNPAPKNGKILLYRHLRKLDEFLANDSKDAKELKEYLKTNCINYL